MKIKRKRERHGGRLGGGGGGGRVVWGSGWAE